MADDKPISLANVNGRIVAHDEAPSSEVSHDGVITIKQIEEPRDVVVIVNRLSDTFGSVTGIGRIDDGIYRFLYRRY